VEFQRNTDLRLNLSNLSGVETVEDVEDVEVPSKRAFRACDQPWPYFHKPPLGSGRF
jgi:hypothetical protein